MRGEHSWPESPRQDGLSEEQRRCLQQFLQVLSNQRCHLIQCYDQQDFPRTNNELERRIRAIKTRYRRITGRKNWNSYPARVMEDVWLSTTGGNKTPSTQSNFCSKRLILIG